MEKFCGEDVISRNEEEDELVLPGFRFYPTDEELLGFYLRRKVEGNPLRIDQLIKNVDIYKYDPWDLPRLDNNKGDTEWYFFCMRGRKYKNSVRPNRVTGSGFWKATGIDKPVYSTIDSGECVGLKKSLVYYRGSAGKGTKTDWMMHEFRLPPPSHRNADNNLPNKRSDAEDEAEIWTLCRIFKRTPSPSKRNSPESKDKRPDNAVKQTTISNTIDLSSKTSSFDSGYGEHYLSFGNSIIAQQSDRKLMTDEYQYKYLQFEPSNTSFWHGDRDFVPNTEFDEPGSGVELQKTIDSSRVYGF